MKKHLSKTIKKPDKSIYLYDMDYLAVPVKNNIIRCKIITFKFFFIFRYIFSIKQHKIHLD